MSLGSNSIIGGGGECNEGSRGKYEPTDSEPALLDSEEEDGEEEEEVMAD